MPPPSVSPSGPSPDADDEADREPGAARRPAQPVVFCGFPEDLFRFLAELERDNSRAFMDANRARFEESVRGPALAFVRAVAPLLRDVAPRLAASDAKSGGSMLRMTRDTRFRTDKRPYHGSVVLRFPHDAEDPRSAPFCGLRLTARAIEVSAGWRAPGPNSLRAVRDAIDAERVAWASARLDVRARAVFGDLGPPELQRVPRDWPADHPFAGDLRRKSFLLTTELPTDAADDASFAVGVVDAWSSATPLLRFLCSALRLPWDATDAGGVPVLA